MILYAESLRADSNRNRRVLEFPFINDLRGASPVNGVFRSLISSVD